MSNGQRIPVELFLEDGCESASMVLRTIEEVGEHFPLDTRIHARATDPAAFIRHGVLITPATYIDGHLAFYGSMTPAEFISYIYNHVRWTAGAHEHV
ncbi:MAG: thioredoxin family protein [Bacteroidetes bacterium]|nr:thioredoxin family protein [Bacteroidota bacterium]